jgi:hypothetical protein
MLLVAGVDSFVEFGIRVASFLSLSSRQCHWRLAASAALPIISSAVLQNRHDQHSVIVDSNFPVALVTRALKPGPLHLGDLRARPYYLSS